MSIAHKALSLLDANPDVKLEVVPAFLSSHGYTYIEDYELQDSFVLPGRYDKVNLRHVFADGSIIDEEWELAFDSRADWDDHMASLAEAAWERYCYDA